MNQLEIPLKKHLLWTQLAVFIVACVAFLNTLRNHFALDDLVHLVNNTDVRTLQAGMGALWTPYFPGNLYRPLVIISYALTYHFFGLLPLPYHLCNVLLHALNAVLVFRIILFYLPFRVAGLSAFLFAIHPLHSEAVANISGRTELLWSFFGLNCLLLSISLLRTTNHQVTLKAFKFVAIFCSALLAFLAKESAANLLVLLPLALAFLVRSVSELRRAMLGFMACVLAAQTYLFMRVQVLGDVLGNNFSIDFLDNPLVNLPLLERVFNALILLGKYIALILAPIELSSDYSFAAIQPASFGFSSVLYSYLVFMLLLLALLEGRKQPSLRFFALWFFAAFFVTSNLFFPIGTVFAERLCYLPSLGLIVLLVSHIENLHSNMLKSVLLGTLCLFFVLRGSERNTKWFDSYTLFSNDIQINPKSAKLQLNYGVTLRNQGDLESAQIYMQKAINTYPQFADAAYNLGLNFLLDQKNAQAEEWLKKATQINPWHTPALDALGRMALNQKDLGQAENYFKRILKNEPHNFSALLGMLAIQINRGELTQASELYVQLSKRDASHQELKQLGLALRLKKSKPLQPRNTEQLDAHIT